MHIHSIQSDSNSLGDRKNARIAMSSNYKDSNHTSFLLGDFQGTGKICSNKQSSHHRDVSYSSFVRRFSWELKILFELAKFELHEFEVGRIDCSYRYRAEQHEGTK